MTPSPSQPGAEVATSQAVASQTPRLQRYRAIIISPHLDDAVFSCGGAIAQMVQQGPVLVLNIFTGDLSQVKNRGVVLGDERYAEEAAAAAFLGYESINLGELDVSFRREPYKQLGNIFRPPVADDMQWLPSLRQRLFDILAPLQFDQIYVPLGIGWHVDHILTYLVFEPWVGRKELVYYEDAPYCCIPHSTRYRLNEIANYQVEPGDTSLAPTNELRAWWQASMAYADTALMKNLQPWFVRMCAVPVVAFYLFRQMALHRRLAVDSPKRSMSGVLPSLGGQFERKVDAMALYTSQFREFFSSTGACAATLRGYSAQYSSQLAQFERCWAVEPGPCKASGE